MPPIHPPSERGVPKGANEGEGGREFLAAVNGAISKFSRVLLPVVSALLLSSALLSMVPTTSADPGVKNAWTVYGGGCPGGCSGHGQCVGALQDGQVDKPGHECKCHSGYTGVACTLRVCPAGRAWADVATAAQTAHADGVECSGFGFCNRQTGMCACRDGFEGNACQRTSCPKGDNSFGVGEKCSGHGTCMTIAEVSRTVDYNYGLFTSVEYTNWDADMVQGCVCEEGWEGFDCSDKSCLWGPDPETTWIDEVQVLDCKCEANCDGWITLTYLGESTRLIEWNAAASVVEEELERLHMIQDVRVTTHGSERGICGPNGAATRIQFLRDSYKQRDYLNITVNTTRLSGTNVAGTIYSAGQSSAYVSTVISVKSTKQMMECSGRGTCNPFGKNNGECMCYPGYGPSSDGQGGLPDDDWNIRDCGSMRTDFNWTGITCPYVAPQWGGSQSICGSKHTACNAQKQCNCSYGYEGGACEWLTCSRGKAWFDVAQTPTKAHQLAPCSNGGKCSRKTGTCSCAGLYEGGVCSQMMCAKNDSYVCGDKGVCMTMNKIATYSTTDGEYNDATYTLADTTWDANKIQACYCRKSMSGNSYDWSENQLGVDGKLEEVAFNTFRGYHSRTHTDFKGFDCSKMECPRGDDPLTPGVNEIQRIYCSATAGGFNIKFRENTTATIDWGDTATQVKRKLEAIFTIGKVNVTFYNETTAGTGGHGSAKGVCNTTYADVEFLTELGDLPLMRINGNTLTGKTVLSGMSGIPKINVTESVAGTKENVECSSHGYCNDDIGMCICNQGYTSSDGQGKRGHRGDCSFRYYDTQIYLAEAESEE